MSRKVLVTGGAGYIGSHMVRLLKMQGYTPVVYDNLERGNRDAIGDTELHVGDLADRSTLDKALAAHDYDAVMHFAALAYVGESVSEPSLYYRNNVGGSLSLLDAMRDAGVKRLVFSSTCATYGVPETLPITEATPQAPINPYGESKLMVEKILADYAVAYGFRSVALRYFNAAGSAEDGSIGERHDPETHLIPLILFEALRVRNGGDPKATSLKVFGSDFPTRDGTCIRDYIHVNDLCSAHTAALEHMLAKPDGGAERFNLGTNHGFTVLEVIEACRRITGVDFEYQLVDRRAGDPPELVADASLAMQTFDWTPAYPDVATSIEHAWRWYLDNPPNPQA
ncbi:MAG: UDP-glucose 4-epimerase GalE [Gammaproteobacteria bacterium]|nr:MAG: UDP-glucose 4-epimerase GalE [Gammaproteobacteria bacterium]